MDINDPNSIAFQFLSYLNGLGAGRKGGGPKPRLNDQQMSDLREQLTKGANTSVFAGMCGRSRAWRALSNGFLTCLSIQPMWDGS